MEIFDVYDMTEWKEMYNTEIGGATSISNGLVGMALPSSVNALANSVSW